MDEKAIKGILKDIENLSEAIITISNSCNELARSLLLLSFRVDELEKKATENDR